MGLFAKLFANFLRLPCNQACCSGISNRAFTHVSCANVGQLLNASGVEFPFNALPLNAQYALSAGIAFCMQTRPFNDS